MYKLLFILASISQIPSYNADVIRERETGDTNERFATPQLTCTLKSSPPRNAVCNERGILKSDPYDFTTNQTLSSLEICRDYCLSWVYAPGNGEFIKCNNFGYNSTSKLCTMRGTAISTHLDDFVVDQSSDSTFSDAHCYSCHRNCPELSSDNILKNGGFEDSSEYYGSWFQPAAYYSELVHPGYKSPNALACNNGTCDLSQSFSLCPYTSYLFSMRLKVVHNQGTSEFPPRINVAVSATSFAIEYNNAQDEQDYEYNNPLTLNSWGRISGSFHSFSALKAMAGDYIGLIFIGFSSPSNNNGTIYTALFDDVSIVSLPKNLVKTGPNLLENGGFESGKLAPWIFTYSNSIHYKGTHGVRMNASLSRGSKYGFYFQDLLKDQGYRYHTGVAGFKLTHTIPPTDPNKLFIVSFKWRAKLTEITNLYVGHLQWEIHHDHEGSSSLHGRNILYSSRVFRGYRKPVNLTIEIIGSDYFSPQEYPQAYIDDVAVHEADAG